MSGPQSPGDDKDNALARTAGLVVFSGIAMSILKALNPLTKNRIQPPQPQPQPLAESTHPIHIPPQEPIFKGNRILGLFFDLSQKTGVTLFRLQNPHIEQYRHSLGHRTVQIVKGDTLWGLSRKNGVSIVAIKEADGLTGDTIYAGKKLIIP